MKKIINNPENFVDETMEGIVLAYGDKVKFLNGRQEGAFNKSACKRR